MVKSEFGSMLAGRTQETINKLASDIGLTQLWASEQLKALPLWVPDFFSQGSGLHGLDTFIIQAILIPKAIIVGILGIVIFSIFFKGSLPIGCEFSSFAKRTGAVSRRSPYIAYTFSATFENRSEYRSKNVRTCHDDENEKTCRKSLFSFLW